MQAVQVRILLGALVQRVGERSHPPVWGPGDAGSNPATLTRSVVQRVDQVEWSPASEAGEREFDSHLADSCCGVAKLVRQLAVNQPIAGSTPATAALRKGKPTGDGTPLEPERG